MANIKVWQYAALRARYTAVAHTWHEHYKSHCYWRMDLNCRGALPSFLEQGGLRPPCPPGSYAPVMKPGLRVTCKLIEPG